MKTDEKHSSKNTLAALVPLSTFSKYIIPFGNFIFPLIIWMSSKNNKLVDAHGRETINFQISIFLYWIFIICAALASIIFIAVDLGIEEYHYIHHDLFDLEITSALPIIIAVGISGVLLLALFILEIICTITATMRASDGKFYKYPLSIPFINPINPPEDEQGNNTQNESL